MSQITTPTKEQILKAAKCSTPKDVLEILFPEAFLKIDIIQGDLPEAASFKCRDGELLLYVSRRDSSKICLSELFNWRIEGNYLIPSHK